MSKQRVDNNKPSNEYLFGFLKNKKISDDPSSTHKIQPLVARNDNELNLRTNRPGANHGV